ncbi:MAG: NfeD family protein [Chloroflexota bacterium]
MMRLRLVFAIISTTLEEAALVIIVLWGLPQLGIRLPLGGLIALMVAWGAFSVFIYRMGSRALRQKPTDGLPAMPGGTGKAVTHLDPEGLVSIRGELWVAKSAGGKIESGAAVTVVAQDGLKLTVRPTGAGET